MLCCAVLYVSEDGNALLVDFDIEPKVAPLSRLSLHTESRHANETRSAKKQGSSSQLRGHTASKSHFFGKGLAFRSVTRNATVIEKALQS